MFDHIKRLTKLFSDNINYAFTKLAFKLKKFETG